MSLNPANKDLVSKCQQGDRRAQFALYQQYSKAMFNICLRMMGGRDQAEDVLQISFVDVFKNLDSYRFEASLGSWIKRIVVNNCITAIKRKKMYFDSIDDEHMQIADFQTEQESTVHMSVEKIKQAMTLLPDGYRTVFSLYLFEGYDHQEIGEILSVSEATSKSQFSRAKKKMRAILANID